MVKRQRWTSERIEGELRQYRANRCRAEELRLDIEAQRELLRVCRDESIEAGALMRPKCIETIGTGDDERGIVMPGSSEPSDATPRLAECLPDETHMRAMSAELAGLERRVRRVDAWMGALSNRERLIIELYYIKGMVWAEVVFTYNSMPTDGIAREEGTMRRWRREGLERIEKVACR